MSLQGKVVFITGAARGMGREYVRGFLREGARVAAADLTWTPSGVSNDDSDFAAEPSGNDDALGLDTDRTIDSHVKRAYEETLRRFGTVDVVINNAGLHSAAYNGAMAEMGLAKIRRLFEVNVMGVIVC